MAKDLMKVYVNAPNGKLVEYMGGPNFSGGKRKCPRCSSQMQRCPIDVPYIKSGDGFILVETQPKDGIMVLSKTEPRYMWACDRCSCGLQPYKPPIVFG